jgi:hypothetical protein
MDRHLGGPENKTVVMASTCRAGTVYFARTISSYNDCLAKRYSRIFVTIPSTRLASVLISITVGAQA